MRDIFANTEDKLKNYKSFKGMVYKPIEQTLEIKPTVFTPSKNVSLLSTEKSKPTVQTSTIAEQPKIEEKPQDFQDYLHDLRNSIHYKDDTEIEINYDENRPSDNNNSFEDFRKSVMKKETGKTDNSAYSVVNMNTNGGKPGSGGWGAYQFIWHWHKDKIKSMFGIDNPQDFLDDSITQDIYFKDWYDNTLIPNMKKFKQEFPDSKLTNKQILDGLHFRGVDDFFKKYREGRLHEKTEANNPSIADRLGI